MKEDFWYPWHHKDWLSSTLRTGMTLAARGAYRDMCDLCAANGNVPIARLQLARAIGCELAELDEVWEEFCEQFLREENDAERIYHPGVREWCSRQEKIRKSHKTNGKKGAEKRWQGHKPGHTASPMASPSSVANGRPMAIKEKYTDKPPIVPLGGETRPAADAFDTTDGPPLPGKPTDPHWRRLIAIYPKATHIQQAADAWRDIVEHAPDPMREADRVLNSARVIDSTNQQKRFLPNLAAFIREKRYLEDWRAAANDTAVHDPLPYVPTWEKRGKEGAN